MRQTVEQIVNDAIAHAVAAGELALAYTPESAVERPRDASHGDWASTIALKLAKELGRSPRDIAQVIVDHLKADESFESVSIAGPGFINLTLSQLALAQIVRTAFEQGTSYAQSTLGGGKTVNVEFISANPTGPMHVGHGRWAALGSALANVLEHAGWCVVREFYINDAGSQMDKFGESVACRYLEELGHEAQLPEGGYGGDYVREVARAIIRTEGERFVAMPAAARNEALRELGYTRMLENMQKLCERIGVHFDVWFSERELYRPSPGCPDGGSSALERTLAALEAQGYLYESEGALWFCSTSFGDDKDRVLRKANGEYTYFAPDIAYHQVKCERNRGNNNEPNYLIDIWGADHHGYIRRMQAACSALGYEGRLTVVLGQLVNLFRNGEAVRMSKRTGEMISFEELLDEVGADATKYLMLSRSADQPIDFDIEVAKHQDATNPVYYVQYAHARICSVLRKAAEACEQAADAPNALGAPGEPSAPDAPGAQNAPGAADLTLLTHESERALIRLIGQLPDLVEQCARELAPYKLTHYAEELAACFHRFYTDCVIIGTDDALTAARLYLAKTTRSVLALTLGLLGVGAPQRM